MHTIECPGASVPDDAAWAVHFCKSREEISAAVAIGIAAHHDLAAFGFTVEGAISVATDKERAVEGGADENGVGDIGWGGEDGGIKFWGKRDLF